MKRTKGYEYGLGTGNIGSGWSRRERSSDSEVGEGGQTEK